MYTISFFLQKCKVEIDTSDNIVYNGETFIHREGAFVIRTKKDRRALHQIPELDRQLDQTVSYLRGELEGLGCQLFSPIEGSLCAFFDFGAEKSIAFRADMDALPIAEKTGAPYASRHPGRMHACGHDGHMAIALELARRLGTKQHLSRNVLLVFQPAEEASGGAKPICDTGIFEKYHVEAIFGLHLWPGLETGKIFSKPGEMMSRSAELDVDIFGKSAHIGRSWEGIDATEAACVFLQKAYALERSVPADIRRLLKFGHIQSGTVRNALSAHARMEGGLRAFSDEVFFGLRDRLLEIAKEVENQFGCTVKVHTSNGYPAIHNPKELHDRVQAIAPFEHLEEPSMTTEDFSWYQRYVPGMFFFLGLGDTPALHSDKFDFDESVLNIGADFFEKIAEGWA
ncbi:MAG: amidohydrolase [Oscillospiraceae bacterium]|nr:amidohydrolase [Oscillospiraceae bacterium]